MKTIGRPHRRRGPLPRQGQPNAIRLAYFRAILDVLAQAKRLVEHAGPILRAALERAVASRSDGIRLDMGEDDPSEVIDRLSFEFFREFTNARLAEIARVFAGRTSDFQREQIARQFKNALGIDIVKAEPWLLPLIESFTADNVALIKSIPQKYFTDVEKTVVHAMREGLRWEEVAKDLDDRFEVAEGHAKLVARDQVGKFLGETNEARQADLGIESFIWRTVRDNRVRDSHAELEGEEFRWNDPPIVDGEPTIPSQAVNCRCEAEPVLGPILEALEEQ